MSKRDRIEPNSGEKRYVRRDESGQFGEQADVGRSLTADRRQHARGQAGAGRPRRSQVS